MGSRSLLVDLRVAQVHRERGIARYCQALVLSLAAARPDLDIACLVEPDRDHPSMLDSLAGHTRIVWGTTAIGLESQPITHFLQGGLFEERKPVRVLFPPELGRHQPQLGAVIYDLIPWVFPEAYLSDYRFARDYLRVLPALSRLDRLFALAESVRRDAIAIANVEPSRIVTIYGGLDESRWTAPDALPDEGFTEDLQMRFRNEEGEAFVVPGPFWLYVAGDDFRKNLLGLFEAVALLKREGRLDLPLVVACSITPERRRVLLRQATRMGLRPGIDLTLTGYVSDQTLGRLFASCVATIFPSFYEGLGLPVLESYAFGKPVLASDTSSFRELVPLACRFDPTSAESIAEAMRRFQEDPRVAEESMAFAPKAIAIGRWSNAVAAIGAWVDGDLQATEATPREEPLWVATSLPPESSGVAYYTQRSLAAPSGPVAFFTPTRGAVALEASRRAVALTRHGLQLEPAPAEVFSIASLIDARVGIDRRVLFVLGNSDHHLGTIAHLMANGAEPGDAVHLHDVFLRGLLGVYFETEGRLRDALAAVYPAETTEEWNRMGAKVHADTSGPLGPRLLVRLAGVRNFIVNSVVAADRLRADLGDDGANVRIDNLFLPVLPARPRLARRDPSRLRLGHFGSLHSGKQPDRLIAACDMLSARRAIELVVAGYGVNRYIQDHGLRRSYLRVIESPSDDDLEVLMSAADCAVQLRYPDHGESSGVVNQLVALHRPVICTRSGSFEEMEGIVQLVAPDISPVQLASTIEVVAEAGWPDRADRLIAARSTSIFEARLRDLLVQAGSKPTNL
jgi:glycosyltransferase involved in cell wall biosynthesis